MERGLFGLLDDRVVAGFELEATAAWAGVVSTDLFGVDAFWPRQGAWLGSCAGGGELLHQHLGGFAFEAHHHF